MPEQEASPSEIEAAKERLALYQSGQPYHQPAVPKAE
jgi:hypothetical protein